MTNEDHRITSAKEEFAAAEAEVAQAADAVELERERFALGGIPRNALQKAQNALARAVERQEQARALIRAVEKRVEFEAEEAARERRRESWLRSDAAKAAYDGVELRLRRWVQRVSEEYEAFDKEVARLGVDFPGFSTKPRPGATRPGHEFARAVWGLGQLYPKLAGKELSNKEGGT